LEITDYQSIRKKVIQLGKEDIVRIRAKRLQIELSEPGTDVPYTDAYEMAYHELIDSSSISF